MKNRHARDVIHKKSLKKPRIFRQLAMASAVFLATSLSSCAALAKDEAGAFPGIFPFNFMKTASGPVYMNSIQLFEITIAAGSTSNTATISSVNTSLSWISFCGFTITGGSAGTTVKPRVDLTSATVVTATRNSSSATDSVTVRGYVLEAKSALVSSVQQGTIAVNGTSSGTATITAVTTSRAVVFPLGMSSASTTTSILNLEFAVDLTNSTTVTATRNSSTGNMTVGYVVVEFQAAVIKSVQQRSVTLSSNTTTDTDTISSVTTGNTLLIWNNFLTATSVEVTCYYFVTLSNGTTVTLTRTGTSTSSRTIKYTVLEFVSGVLASKQAGSTAVASTTSANSSISSVNTSRAHLNFCGYSTSASTASEIYATAKLAAATTVTGNKGVAGTTTSTPGWEVVEWN